MGEGLQKRNFQHFFLFFLSFSSESFFFTLRPLRHYCFAFKEVFMRRSKKIQKREEKIIFPDFPYKEVSFQCLCEKPNAKVKRCLSAEVYRFFKFRGCSPLVEASLYTCTTSCWCRFESLAEHRIVIYVIHALESLPLKSQGRPKTFTIN